MAIASSGGELIPSKYGLEVCVFVPSPAPPEVPDTLQGIDLPVVTLSGEASAVPAYPAVTVNSSGIEVTLPESCDAPVNPDEMTQVFDSVSGVSVAACVFWDEQTESWGGSGCEAVAVLKDGIVCRCSHMTDFASRLELLARTNREIFEIGTRPITLADVRSNPQVFIAVGAMTLAIIVSIIVTVWVEIRDRQRFSTKLLADPEVVVIRDLARLEGAHAHLSSAFESHSNRDMGRALDSVI